MMVFWSLFPAYDDVHPFGFYLNASFQSMEYIVHQNYW